MISTQINSFHIIENIDDICGIVHLGDCLDRRKFVNYKIAKDFRERFIWSYGYMVACIL